MTPYEFLARLAAIVPHPREHQLTYQGVLAPASPLRDSVVPRSVKGRESNTGKRIGTKSSQCPAKRSSGQNYIPWTELLRRVFGEDVLRCPHCRGRRHMISANRKTDGSGSGAKGVGIGSGRAEAKEAAATGNRNPHAGATGAAGLRDVGRRVRAVLKPRGPWA